MRAHPLELLWRKRNLKCDSAHSWMYGIIFQRILCLDFVPTQREGGTMNSQGKGTPTWWSWGCWRSRSHRCCGSKPPWPLCWPSAVSLCCWSHSCWPWGPRKRGVTGGGTGPPWCPGDGARAGQQRLSVGGCGVTILPSRKSGTQWALQKTTK